MDVALNHCDGRELVDQLPCTSATSELQGLSQETFRAVVEGSARGERCNRMALQACAIDVRRSHTRAEYQIRPATRNSVRRAIRFQRPAICLPAAIPSPKRRGTWRKTGPDH